MLAHKGIEASRTDLPAAIKGRPAGQHAREVAPDYPGHVRSTLPAEWLAPLLARAG
jgi:hypothetical protein